MRFGESVLNFISAAVVVAVAAVVVWAAVFLVNIFKVVQEPDPEVAAKEDVRLDTDTLEFLADKKL